MAAAIGGYMKALKILVFGYIGFLVLAVLLLLIPSARGGAEPIPVLDTVFTAFAVVSTAGLTLFDTAGYYSLFGEIIVLFIIQVCGVGYMFFVSMALLGFLGKVDLNSKLILKESMNTESLSNTLKLLKATMLFTVFFETAGAGVMYIRWAGEMGKAEALYHSIFHSISAFCTAGYSSFHGGLGGYASDPVIAGVISTLSIFGGLGFIVLYNLFEFAGMRKKGRARLAPHTKIVLKVTLLLFAGGFIVYFLSELGRTGFTKQALAEAFFQVMSASTTSGFSDVDMIFLNETTLFMMTILMFVGASSGGTGGGIKTTTLAVTGAFLKASLREKNEVNIGGREIKPQTIRKALTIFLLSFLWVIMSSFLLSVFEGHRFYYLLIESVAAFGTGGISAGITESLTPGGKIIIMITMLAGRAGPIAMGIFLTGRGNESHIKYPEAGIMVG